MRPRRSGGRRGLGAVLLAISAASEHRRALLPARSSQGEGEDLDAFAGFMSRASGAWIVLTTADASALVCNLQRVSHHAAFAIHQPRGTGLDDPARPGRLAAATWRS